MQFLQVSHCLALELLFVAFRSASMYSGLKVAIQILIRIELRGVSRQVEHLDLVAVLSQPAFDDLGMVNPQIIQNQKDFTVGVLDQTLHEVDQDIGVHAALEEPESNLALIGDSRYQIDGLAFRTQANDRGLSFRRISTGMLTVTAQSRLVAPVNLCLFCLCPGLNSR